jgi:hypothetical protein
LTRTSSSALSICVGGLEPLTVSKRRMVKRGRRGVIHRHDEAGRRERYAIELIVEGVVLVLTHNGCLVGGMQAMSSMKPVGAIGFTWAPHSSQAAGTIRNSDPVCA